MAHVGQAVQEAVFVAEHRGWAHNGGLGENIAGYGLAAGLGTVELRGRVGEGRVRRDLDEAVDIVLCNGVNDAVGSVDVDVVEVEVLGGVVSANQIVDNVRVTDRLLDGCSVAQIVFLGLLLGCWMDRDSRVGAYHEDNTTEITGDLEVTLGHLLSEGHDDCASCAGCVFSVNRLLIDLAGGCVPSLLTM